MSMLRNRQFILVLIVLMLPSIFGCRRRPSQRPQRETIYILNRDVQAGETFTKSVVNEIGYTDYTGQVDLIKAVNLLTPSNVKQYLGRKFVKDAPEFTPLSADLLGPGSS